MASTGAVLYVRPTVSASTTANRSTAAALFVPVRVVSGLVTGSGVTASRNLNNLQSLLPPARQPIAYQTQQGLLCDPQWYRFFDFFVNTFLGNTSGLTLQDIISAMVTAQSSATEAEVRAALIAAQSQTNAEALSAAVQVVQTAALPGSQQIPSVKLSYLD